MNLFCCWYIVDKESFLASETFGLSLPISWGAQCIFLACPYYNHWPTRKGKQWEERNYNFQNKDKQDITLDNWCLNTLLFALSTCNDSQRTKNHLEINLSYKQIMVT